MSRRRTALAAALALLPLGQPLLLGTLGITTATTAVVLQAAPVVAQDSSAVARIAKAITVRIEGATQGSGVLVKREGNRYTVLLLLRVSGRSYWVSRCCCLMPSSHIAAPGTTFAV